MQSAPSLNQAISDLIFCMCVGHDQSTACRKLIAKVKVIGQHHGLRPELGLRSKVKVISRSKLYDKVKSQRLYGKCKRLLRP